MKNPFYEVYLQIGRENIILTNYIDSFDYEDCLNEDDMLTLKVVSKDFELLDNKQLKIGVNVFYKFGYLEGATSQLRQARITDIEVSYAELIHITIKAYDLGQVMKRSKEQKIWKNITSSEIAKQIADKYGLKADIEKTDTIHNSLPQGSKTDFELLKYLASIEKNGSFHFYIKGDTLFFTRKKMDKTPRRLFIYRDNSPTAQMISFKPALRESSQSRESVSMKAVGFNPIEQKTKEVSLTPEKAKDNVKLGNSIMTYDANAKPLGILSSRQNQENTKNEAKKEIPILPMPDMDLGNITNKANKKHKSSGEKILVATLTIEGDPTLQINEIITIQGVAKIHTGNWYIEKIKHTISNSGYITTLELTKNAINSYGNVSTKQDSHFVVLGSEVKQNQEKANQSSINKKEIPLYNANGVQI